MSWNYRVFKIVDESDSDQTNEYYEIYEVYYENNIPWARSQEPVTPIGDTIQELKDDISYYLKAFDESVIDMKDFDEMTEAMYESKTIN